MNNLLNDLKAGITLCLGMIGSGVATALEWLPVLMGVITSLIGAISLGVLIYLNIMRNRREKEQDKRDRERHAIEMEILKKQRDE